ncbi:hypothetical protein AX14_008812 [Amanita brunnescens Koide BX004]|nr:hypothetical protein AX14_008812 [Amanita brunnescens Koide BX004]
MANYSHIGPYLPTRRLAGEHGDSVISLAFSTKGRYLASGSDDSILVIWDVEAGTKVFFFRLDSPALSLVWDSHREDRLFVGCMDGTAAFIDKLQGALVPILTGLRHTPVYALAADPFAQPCRIAIGAGPEVHIATAISESHYATNSILPTPSTLPRGRVEEEDADDRVRARSLHFTNRGRNLVVSYLNHGIVCWDVATSAQLWCIEPTHTHRHIGFSAISPDETEIAISNLSTGVDVYSLKSMMKIRSFSDTILPDTNYPIGVEFLANGSFVSSGSHTGRPCVWEKHSCAVFQVLDHGLPGKLVRCIAVSVTSLPLDPPESQTKVRRSGDGELVATATTGRNPCIQIWASRQHECSYAQQQKLLRIDLDSARHESPSQLLLWAQDKFIEKLRARVPRRFYQFCLFFAITAFIIKPSTVACTYP